MITIISLIVGCVLVSYLLAEITGKIVDKLVENKKPIPVPIKTDDEKYKLSSGKNNTY